MDRWLVVGLLGALGMGCYTRRHIVVPPTEHGQFCVKDASMSFQLCVMQQRGTVFCQQRMDRELLMCDGAYEVTADASGGPSDAGVEETYQLPGFRP